MTIDTAADNLHGETRRTTRAEVGAQVLQNFAGGCGVAIVIGALQSLAGVPVLAHWHWPAYIGALAFGATMFVRSQLDEYKGWLNIESVKRAHTTEMQILCAHLDGVEAERDALRSEAATLRADLSRTQNELAAVRYMRTAAGPSERHVNPLDTYSPAQRADARALLGEWYARGAWPGERSMSWTRSRHTTARDLLIAVGVMPSPPSSAAPPPESEAWAVAKLMAAYGESNGLRTGETERA